MRIPKLFAGAISALGLATIIVGASVAADEKKRDAFKPPPKDANKPPEQWQTYDITFHSPRVDDDGKVTEKGRLTVVFNGETVIDDGRFDKNTAGEIDTKLGTPGPILLQDHGCKVRFRNIWLEPLEK